MFQGTWRPSYYHVMHDEIGFAAVFAFQISSNFQSCLVHMLKRGCALDTNACKSHVNMLITNMPAEKRGSRSLMV